MQIPFTCLFRKFIEFKLFYSISYKFASHVTQHAWSQWWITPCVAYCRRRWSGQPTWTWFVSIEISPFDRIKNEKSNPPRNTKSTAYADVVEFGQHLNWSGRTTYVLDIRSLFLRMFGLTTSHLEYVNFVRRQTHSMRTDWFVSAIFPTLGQSRLQPNESESRQLHFIRSRDISLRFADQRNKLC